MLTFGCLAENVRFSVMYAQVIKLFFW